MINAFFFLIKGGLMVSLEFLIRAVLDRRRHLTSSCILQKMKLHYTFEHLHPTGG